MKKTRRPNRPSWEHGHKTVPVPGTAIQLPNIVIPDGFDLVVRALPSNEQDIHLGKSKADAEDTGKRLTFSHSNGITLKVKDANVVWVDADKANEGIDYWVEQ